jgi:hypothetical protein
MMMRPQLRNGRRACGSWQQSRTFGQPQGTRIARPGRSVNHGRLGDRTQPHRRAKVPNHDLKLWISQKANTNDGCKTLMRWPSRPRVAHYEDAAKSLAADTHYRRRVPVVQIRIGGGRYSSRYTPAGTPCRTRAAASRRICLGAGLLGMDWPLFQLGIGHLGGRTPQVSLGCRSLGPDWKPVAVRPGSLGAASAVLLRPDALNLASDARGKGGFDQGEEYG